MFYSADGNQTLILTPAGARTTTSWDYDNKTTLIRLPSGIRNTMSYDPEGLRVKLEESTGVKKYVYDGQAYLLETDNSNVITATYTQEPTTYGNLISHRRGSTTSLHLFDGTGSSTELLDNSQNVTDSWLYDAYGNILSRTGTTETPFQWHGSYGAHTDNDTKLIQMRARIINPRIAIFTAADMAGFVNGMNLYKPYFVPNGADPSGLMSISCQCTKWNPGMGPFTYTNTKARKTSCWSGKVDDCCKTICATYGESWRTGEWEAAATDNRERVPNPGFDEGLNAGFATVCFYGSLPFEAVLGEDYGFTERYYVAWDATSLSGTWTQSATNAFAGTGVGAGYLAATLGGATYGVMAYETATPYTYLWVSRWGAAGLPAGGWVMKGSPTYLRYLLSGKKQWWGTNIPAPYDPTNKFGAFNHQLSCPPGFWGELKYCLGQRIYEP